MTRINNAIALLVVALLLASAGCAPDRIEDHEFSEEVTHLFVEAEAGTVEIQAADTDVITLRAEIYGEGKTELIRTFEDGELTLEAEIDWPCAFCRIDFAITVPRGVAVSASSGSGDVLVVGLEADLVASSGSGDVDIDGFYGESLIASNGSGNVRAVGLEAAQVVASSGSGDVRLTLDAEPSSLVANTGSGNQNITVPSGTYAVEWEVRSGRFDIDGVVVDDNASSSLELNAGSGAVTLHGR